MRVLFVIPKTSKGACPYAWYPHTGIGYLVAVLKEHMHTTWIVDMQLGYPSNSFSIFLVRMNQILFA
jgi:hypothetical protein